MNSERYDYYILSKIQEFMNENPGLIFMQDNAPSHQSQQMIRNLQRRGINYIKAPLYLPDLNLIKHV